ASQQCSSGSRVRCVTVTEPGAMSEAESSRVVSKDPGPHELGFDSVPKVASAFVSVGFFWSISAAIPEIVGAEKLVPLIHRYWNGAALALSGVALLAQVRTFVLEITWPSL